MNIYIEPNLGAGVYAIINETNGKRYIGASTDVSKRLMNHIQSLKSGKHIIPDLQRDFEDGHRFTYEVLYRPHMSSKDYVKRALITMEHEHIMKSDVSMLYNRELTPPYIWNTIVNIPDQFRDDDFYHAGDIDRPDYQKWIIRPDGYEAIESNKMLTDIMSWNIPEDVKIRIAEMIGVQYAGYGIIQNC